MIIERLFSTLQRIHNTAFKTKHGWKNGTAYQDGVKTGVISALYGWLEMNYFYSHALVFIQRVIILRI